MESRIWVENFLDRTKEKWFEISDFIWEHPEIRFEEFESARHLTSVLREEGFAVEEGIAGIDTAFVAEYGQGSPLIAFLGEYDALPNLSQKAGVTEIDPLESGGHGHGCGHNLLGTGALAAAVTIKEYLREHNKSGTVRYYGCPAEEGGSGKTFMAREGAFDGVDLVLTWHPGPVNAIWSFGTLANIQAYFKFTGRSAHAAAAPHLGRSALDAVELMNVGVNYMREHMIDEAKVHYAVTNTGGNSPNVVQAEAEVLQLIRAPDTEQATQLFERIKKIAEGAALMTETEVEVVFDKACSNFIPSNVLNEVLEESMAEIGPVDFTEDEFDLAKEFQATFSKGELASANMGIKALDFALEKPLSDLTIPYIQANKLLPGSTDVGDVSWVAPTAQVIAPTVAVGTPFHTWQFVAQGKTSYAHKGMLQAAKYLALTAVKSLLDEQIILDARVDHENNLAGKKYICPIPKEIKPNQAK